MPGSDVRLPAPAAVTLLRLTLAAERRCVTNRVNGRIHLQTRASKLVRPSPGA